MIDPMNSPVPSPAVSDVTLVVTCYNHQSFIEQCLESVAGQTFPARQVIIIDDFSRDDSAETISRWLEHRGTSYTFIRHTQNVGVCASLNEALALAEGRYFCHVSGDDWEELDRLEVQIPAFDAADQSAAFLVGDIREVDVGGLNLVDHDFHQRLDHITGLAGQHRLLSSLLKQNSIPAPSTLAHTGRIREIGGYDESLAFEDYDLWLRLSLHYSVEYVPGIVSNYRIVNSGLTRNTARRGAVLTSEADMLAKHIGRSPADDVTISVRLLRIAHDLLELELPRELRGVLVHAAKAKNDPWVRKAISQANTRGGLDRIRRHHFAELGIAADGALPLSN